MSIEDYPFERELRALLTAEFAKPKKDQNIHTLIGPIMTLAETHYNKKMHRMLDKAWHLDKTYEGYSDE